MGDLMNFVSKINISFVWRLLLKRLLLGAVILYISPLILAGDTDIRLNSLGFIPGLSKKASIISECSDFTIKKASGNFTLFSGKVTETTHQNDIKQDMWKLDKEVSLCHRKEKD